MSRVLFIWVEQAVTDAISANKTKMTSVGFSGVVENSMVFLLLLGVEEWVGGELNRD